MANANSSAATAVLSGMWRFAVVSLFGFGFWAIDSKILPKGIGEMGTFVGSLVFFVAAAEIFLVGLVDKPEARRKFHRSFVPAFLLYAITWSVVWFAFRFKTREWVASALACAVFAWVLGARLGAKNGFLRAILFLIMTHSAGYFLGGKVFYMARNPPEALASWPKADVWMLAKMAWGLCYGLGFGAGIGYAFHTFQRRDAVTPARASR